MSETIIRQEHLIAELETALSPTPEGCKIWCWGLTPKGKPKLPPRYPTRDALLFYFVCLGYMKQQTKYCRGTKAKNLCGRSLCFNPDHYQFIEPKFKSAERRPQLSPTEVALIREQWEKREKTAEELAAEYNRSGACIRNIVKGRSH